MTTGYPTIWKFTFPVQDELVLSMPAGAEILHVEAQRGDVPCLWARVDSDAELEDRHFFLRGTGHPVEADWRHVGTFMLADGHFVGHLFERA